MEDKINSNQEVMTDAKVAYCIQVKKEKWSNKGMSKKTPHGNSLICMCISLLLKPLIKEPDLRKIKWTNSFQAFWTASINVWLMQFFANESQLINFVWHAGWMYLKWLKIRYGTCYGRIWMCRLNCALCYNMDYVDKMKKANAQWP